MLDRATGHVVALAGDDVHVGAERADIARGVVATVDRLHEASVRTQQRLGLEGVGVTDDDGLAATEVETGEGGLVGHALRKIEDVGESFLLGAVRVEARSAERRAQGGGVDRDDGLEAGRLVVAEHDLLVLAAECGRRGAWSRSR